jgi:hypothetical protein
MKPSVRRGHPQSDEVSSRCPRQRAVQHEPGYEPGPEEIDQIRRGAAVFVAGRALAKMEFVCRELGASEGFWYCTAGDRNPTVLDILLPRQQVSGCSCHVGGREVLRAERQARRRGQKIVGAGHSHGHLGLFSSTVDEEQVEQLVRECAALVSTSPVSIEGQLRRLDGEEEGAFEATFPPHGARAVIHVGNGKVQPGSPEPRVRLELPTRRTVSFFSTSTSNGQHLFPTVEALCCPICGLSEVRRTAAEDVTVHVIGPVAITGEEETALRSEVEEKVERLAGGWYRDPSDRHGWGDDADRMHGDTDAPGARRYLPACRDSGEWSGMAVSPAPFEIYREGRYLATLSAALVEEAAARCAPLGAALGWTDPAPPPAKQRR